MYNSKTDKYFLILGNFRLFSVMLLFVVGVFLFPKTALLSTISSEKIIELSNQERVANNLKALNTNQYLSQAAHNKALDIFKNQRFEHNFDDRRFSAWIREVGYQYKYVGENLAVDFVTSEGLMNAWIGSPSHYKNIINNKFSEIGVAVIEGIFQNETSIVVVQIFGTPLVSNQSVNLDKNIDFTSIQNKKTTNKEVNYLTHSSQHDLNIFTKDEMFLNLSSEDRVDFENTENGNKSLDLLFTLAGFIYLGLFKIISLKNIGL